MAKPAELDGSPLARADEHEDASGPENYKVVSIRLRTAEYENFRDQAEALGLTNNMALRIAARRIGGFLELDPEVRRQLIYILRALGEISENIRSLHADYLKSGVVDLDQLSAQRVAFGREFVQLDGLLRSVLNISQRRVDGRRKLEAAMG